ncbi:unnamed protein product [Bursaphelenchus okinawaensis]|uniref:Uncharacterized protein n=1 Tax=Bursaphelenchus okinawaensis TaxID=465554 RepID=A0A811JVL7_9BILA|nr:unnamed protein product [Bursaphelenchus okinawaensis]CAG9086061.1 unnamed protein product [Bursaphelenchus okinawaensis]
MTSKLSYFLLLLLLSTVLLDTVECRKKKKDKNKSRQLPEEKEDEEARRAHLTVNVDMDQKDDDDSSSDDDDDKKDKKPETSSPLTKVDPSNDKVYQVGPDNSVVGTKSRKRRSHGAKHIPVYHVHPDSQTAIPVNILRHRRFSGTNDWIYNVL